MINFKHLSKADDDMTMRSAGRFIDVKDEQKRKVNLLSDVIIGGSSIVVRDDH